jgi:chromosome segregation ATPase
MKCDNCGYENKPGDLACNLCGRVLSGRLPKSGLTSEKDPKEPKRRASDRISRPTGIITRRLGKPLIDPKVAGLERLQEAQERVTKKLKKLSELQEESVPILQAQIQAEQDERDLAQELIQAGDTLLSKTHELRQAEDGIRTTRKKLAELKFKLKQRVEERLKAASDEEDAETELKTLQRIDRELHGEEAVSQARDEAAAVEIKGLQGVCMRLSERITILNLKLNDRDSYLHWLLDLQNTDRGKERADQVTALLKAVTEANPDDPDCVRWLEGEWKRLVRSLAGSSQE